MPDWNRIIAGHVFKAPSCDTNYYCEFLFVCTFLRFFFEAISSMYSPGSPAYRTHGTANGLMEGEKTNGMASGRERYAQHQLESRVSRGILSSGALWHGQFPEPI
jgi:hypothetical protein